MNIIQTKLPLSQIVKKYPLWYRGFRRITKKLKIGNTLLEKFQNQLLLSHQIPIDQTMRNAVAQIQILAKCTKKN